MRQELATPDQNVARLAAQQHGAVSSEQLLAAGLSPSGITRRVRSGHLHRIHRSVYAVGHRGLGNEGRWMAAVLALGQGAALSHRPAAELWVLLVPRTGSIDVSVPGRGGREKRPGLRIHRSPSLTSAVTTTRRGIAVTTPARTLADLHRVASPVEYRRAVRQAEVSGYELGGVEVDGTRSELERLVLRLCRRYRLPPPEVNQRVGPYLVDFLWRERRLVVEVDGWRYHRGRQAFDDDRARDVQLQLHGYRVARFADRQLERDSVAVVAAIRRLLED